MLSVSLVDTSSSMNTDALAPKWIFYYFQVFGLHSVSGKRRISCCFQICFLITLLSFYFVINYVTLSQTVAFNTLDAVSLGESIVFLKKTVFKF